MLLPAAVLLASLLAAEPAKPAAITRLAAPNFTAVQLDAKVVEFLAEHFADQLVRRGFTVTTAREIQTLLGMERQKALLGCTESTSCAAEIANALGVDAIIAGDVARFGSVIQLNIKVLDARAGKRVASYSARVPSEDQLLDAATRGAEEIATQLRGPTGGAPAPRPLSAAGQWWWAPAAAGVVSGVAGGVALAVSADQLDALSNPQRWPLQPDTAQSYRENGPAIRTLGWVGVGGAVVGLGAAAWMFLALREPPALAVVPTAQGAFFVFSGELR